MEFIVILATLAVVVLQIITISVVNSLKKKVDELKTRKSAHSNNNDRDRRDRESRPQQNRKRPASDARSRSQKPTNTTSSSSVDQVEKSLRDINLKLKNAERDQENARKKMQNNFSKDVGKRKDSRDNAHRGARDNNRKDARRGGNNWQSRNNRRDNAIRRTSEVPNDSMNSENLEKKLPVEEFKTQQPVSNKPVTPVTSNVLQSSDFNSSDNLQHGRKVTVKRRMLKEEDSVIKSNSSETNDKSEVSNQNESKDIQTGSDSESEITFGRK